jgi:IclR family transcriptional regulator, KDG regulon repressor
MSIQINGSTRVSGKESSPVFSVDNSSAITSVARAFALLEQLAFADTPMPLADISKTLKLAPSTTHRFLRTLVGLGFVVQDKTTDRYQATLKLFDLGSMVLGRFNLPERLLPTMRRIADQVADAVSLVVREGTEGVLLERVEAAQEFQVFTKYRRIPLYCSAAGKVLLAGFDSANLQGYLARTVLQPLTENTITDTTRLRQEIEKIRKMGFSIDNEELQMGARCVAVPLVLTNDTVASLSVSGLTPRMTDMRIGGLVAILRTAIAELGFASVFSDNKGPQPFFGQTGALRLSSRGLDVDDE